MICYNCGKPNHSWRRCRIKRNIARIQEAINRSKSRRRKRINQTQISNESNNTSNDDNNEFSGSNNGSNNSTINNQSTTTNSNNNNSNDPLNWRPFISNKLSIKKVRFSDNINLKDNRLDEMKSWRKQNGQDSINQLKSDLPQSNVIKQIDLKSVMIDDDKHQQIVNKWKNNSKKLSRDEKNSKSQQMAEEMEASFPKENIWIVDGYVLYEPDGTIVKLPLQGDTGSQAMIFSTHFAEKYYKDQITTDVTCEATVADDRKVKFSNH